MSHARLFAWSSSARSETGHVREVNEDAFLDFSANGIWAVADGMGGHDAGDVASTAVVAALATVTPNSRPSVFIAQIEECLSKVNRDLYDLSVKKAAGICGATVAVLAVFDAYVVCLWAGDSRIYRRRGRSLELITRDHTKVREAIEGARSWSTGVLPASNIITRAVGGTADLVLDLELREIRDGDSYLICTDGLYRELSDTDLVCHLQNHPGAACDAMLAQALRGPCKDNATAVTVAFRRQ
jgi:serine/threonine protein phosphatase PrpC